MLYMQTKANTAFPKRLLLTNKADRRIPDSEEFLIEKRAF